MSNLKLLYKILRLKGMKITRFWFKNRNKELHLTVKPYKNGCRCPECGRRGRIVRQTTEFRQWEDITLMGMKVLLWYTPKEIDCPTHGRLQEAIPWAPAYSRITYRLEWRLCALCQIMTQKAAAEILKMAPSTLSDQLHRIITRVRDGHKIRGVTTLGVDEISFLKGRKFATLVYDLDRSHVLWVGRGKGRETIDRFFNECLSKGQKARILWASCDMSRAYTEAIKHHCPNATLVIDRFHVVKALNQAVDEVRKDEWRALDTDGRKAIKGLRWLLSMHSSNRTKGAYPLPQQPAQLQSPHPPRLGAQGRVRAVLELHLSRLGGEVPQTLDDRRAAKSYPSLRKFVDTLKNHYDNIIAFIDRNLTNAVGEGLNRIVKIVKNRASGYRNLDSFADIIYLTVGDLDIPARIPSDLRSL